MFEVNLHAERFPFIHSRLYGMCNDYIAQLIFIIRTYVHMYIRIHTHACIAFLYTMLTCSCYSLAFSQPATDPSSICEGSNVP